MDEPTTVWDECFGVYIGQNVLVNIGTTSTLIVMQKYYTNSSREILTVHGLDYLSKLPVCIKWSEIVTLTVADEEQIESYVQYYENLSVKSPEETGLDIKFDSETVAQMKQVAERMVQDYNKVEEEN